jgi:alkylation response protein AidB-like acyl-CoA dehydrogenase
VGTCAHRCAGFTEPLFYLHSDIVAPYLQHYGTEAQKRQWLPRMARGEVIGAIGMTESGAGSDLAGIRTTATGEPGGWRVRGQKIFISNGQLCDLLLLAAKTQPDRGAAVLVGWALVPTIFSAKCRRSPRWAQVPTLRPTCGESHRTPPGAPSCRPAGSGNRRGRGARRWTGR